MDTIPVNKIIWGDRARKDYGDVTALAESIKTKGLIQPIVLDNDHNLVAGGRRLSAMITLNWLDIPYVNVGTLSQLQLRELELEENLQRKDLTWQENALLIAEIHKLKVALNGDDWTIDDTKELVNKDKTTTYYNLKLAEGLEKFPELAKAKDYSSAKTQLRRKVAHERRALVAKEAPTYEFLHNVDALNILPKIIDDSIDLVLLDPPYGVNIQNKEGRGTERTGTWTWDEDTYDDTPEYAVSILEDILKEVQRILKPGAHCYIFFGLSLEIGAEGIIHKTIEKYLNYQRLPLFWVKNTQSNKDPYKRFGINYEAIYFCWKGPKPRDLITATHAAFAIPMDARTKEHPSEKPSDLYRKLISISTQEGEIVLDPTAGSGSSIATAVSMSRKAIGIEKDPQWFNVMLEKVNNVKKGEA